MSVRNLVDDLRYAARTLRGSPGFTCLAVLILALGIGANSAVFSLVSAVMLRPLPFVEPDRLVVLWEDFSAAEGPARVNPTLASYAAWRERARSFDDMAAFVQTTYNLTGEGDPERLDGIRTTANLFSLLGLEPLVGRTFTAGDDASDGASIAVISEDLWARRFGADPEIVGRSIRLDGVSRTIVGVVPPDFRFPNEGADVWVPARFTPQELAQRTNYSYYVVARLADGTSLDEAQAEMTTLASTSTPPGSNGVKVTALHEQLSRGARPMLGILLAVVVAVLLITCANVANLLLARAAGRRRELALRKALGAGDGRLLRQLLTESAVLAVLGVGLGVAVSTLSFGYLARLMPGGFPEGAGPALDWRVLVFTAGLALSTVLLSGAGPAFAAARLPLGETLKRGVGILGTTRAGRVRSALVVGEMALTVVLLAAAALLLRSYVAVLGVEPGFRTENLLVAETVLPASRYPDPSARAQFSERVLARVETLPGVVRAAYVNFPPLVFAGGRSLITIEGQPPPRQDNLARYITSNRAVSEQYFGTLGVPLIRGRAIDSRDTADAPRAVVINETMAGRHWPGENPLGGRLRVGGEAGKFSPWYTVVGVVGDVRQTALDAPPEPEMYFSFAQAPGDSAFFSPRHLVVRTAGDPTRFADAVRDAVWQVDADQPVSDVRTMSAIVDAGLASRQTQLTLVGAFAGAALLLAAVGLYGVLSYATAQRTSEVGLRMALGAEQSTVVRSVLGSALRLTGIGVVLGLGAAAGLTRLIGSFLFGVSPVDPATYAVVLGMLLLVALAASYLPARRAARIDPLTALRTE